MTEGSEDRTIRVAVHQTVSLEIRLARAEERIRELEVALRCTEVDYDYLRRAAADYMESPVHGDHKGIYNPSDCCANSAELRRLLDSVRIDGLPP